MIRVSFLGSAISLGPALKMSLMYKYAANTQKINVLIKQKCYVTRCYWINITDAFMCKLEV